MHQYTLQQKTFLALLVLVTIGFIWVLTPYAGAIFWGVVLAILFTPIYRWLMKKTGKRGTVAALITVLLVIVIVILPLSLITVSLANQAALVVDMVKSGDWSMGVFFKRMMAALPRWATGLLERFDLASLEHVQQRLAQGAAQVSQVVAKQAINVGSYTFDFVVGMCIMLYLLFFLLRDGAVLAGRIKSAVPLSRKYKQRLFANFTTVIRATVKGNVLVAHGPGRAGRPGLLVPGRARRRAVGRGDGLPVAAAGHRRGPGLGAGGHLFPRHRRGLAGRRPDRLGHHRDRPGRQFPAPPVGRQGHQDARLRRAAVDPGRHGLVRLERLRDRAR